MFKTDTALGVSGQTCVQEAALTYLWVKLVFSTSVFTPFLETAPGEINC